MHAVSPASDRKSPIFIVLSFGSRMFKHHNSFFPYKAFYLKIKMNTENLVPDDYLIEIWGFKVCQYLPLGRNIGSRNFCSDNPPNTVLCSSVNIYVTTHICWLVQLGWEKVWKIIRKYIQNSRTSSYGLGCQWKVVFGRFLTAAARKELRNSNLTCKLSHS